MIVLYFILFHQEQSNQSMFIFKIQNINPLLCEFIYVLSFLFETCCIVKSSVYNKYKNEKYIICKKLTQNVELFERYKKKMFNIIVNKKQISSLLNKLPPLYFMNILNEINNLFGQEQLYFLEQLIQFYQTPNIKEKIQTLKKSNYEKCKQFYI
jgi:hypothetical protein